MCGGHWSKIGREVVSIIEAKKGRFYLLASCVQLCPRGVHSLLILPLWLLLTSVPHCCFPLRHFQRVPIVSPLAGDRKTCPHRSSASLTHSIRRRLFRNVIRFFASSRFEHGICHRFRRVRLSCG